MSLPARKGGSGKRQIKREINVALFCETGGKVFLKESISFLKGVSVNLFCSNISLKTVK
ncbi:hypothetical protein BY996DRAFT_4479858 [Phakopsora pachyrhizi]|nr:hypothetical protein BY996DRAFT_4479858 [Phakopsora pachyrhizi]